MKYKIELIRKKELQVSKWSGGTTVQLAIYPKNAVYGERNFKWRLSSAKVEAVDSTFTQLPNINRIIMIIEGELYLEHKGQHECTLRPFDQDRFNGGWTTESHGKVIDFNLMMDENCEGELEAMHIEKGQSTEISFYNKKDFSNNVQALYCASGEMNIKINEGELKLYRGDMILIESNTDIDNEKIEIHNTKNNNVDLIRANIYF